MSPAGPWRAARYGLLLIVPALMVVTTIDMDKALGPHWVGMNHDPGLQYLLNSINLATLRPVGHTVHPGTPVQVTGAVIARVVHAVAAPAGEDLPSHVLRNPELYLSSIRTTYLLVIALALVAVGVAALKTLDAVGLALLVQLAPFYPHTNDMFVFGLTQPRPESFLFLGSLLVAAGVIVAAHRRADVRVTIYFGVVCGFAVASKVTFAPVLALPLFVLYGLRQRALYVATTIGAFIFFTLPILAEYPRLAAWLVTLTLHAGVHGQGSGTIVDPAVFGQNLRAILSLEPLFTLILAISVVVLAVGLVVPAWRRVAGRSLYFRALGGVVTAQAGGLVLVAKHFEGWDTYYLMPVVCLSGLALMLIVVCVSLLVAGRDWWLPASSLAVLAMLVGATAASKRTEIVALETVYARARDQRVQVHEQANRNYGGWARIQYLGSSGEEYALYLSNTEAHRYYADALHALYPDAYFFDVELGQIVDWYDKPVAFDTLRRAYHDRIMFQGPVFAALRADLTRGGADSAFKGPGLQLVEVPTGSDEDVPGMRRETIYEFRP